MRVTVFGADNDIGRKVVEELIWRGYEARVFVSDPAAVPSIWGARVQVVGGQLTDPVAVAAAVARAEAVVNALDPRLDDPGAHLREGTVHVVAAMQDHGVHRYVGLGSPAVGLCPKERPTPVVTAHRALLRTLHPRVHGQMRHMMATVTGTELDWTIVRFLRSRGGDTRGLRYVGFFGEDNIGCSATEVDIARFTAAQVMDTAYIDDAPAVSN